MGFSNTLHSTHASEAVAGASAQYLTFMLGSESYAIGILSIKEIIGYTTMTEVPLMPPFVRGVINLRGAVVPVMDLQARFGQPSSAVTKRTCIVIVEVAGPSGAQVMGVVVDAVNAVLDISAADIEPAPSFGTHIRADFIEGMGKVQGRFVIVLNVNAVLGVEDLEAMAQVVHPGAAEDSTPASSDA